jgi:hypothetical protein
MIGIDYVGQRGRQRRSVDHADGLRVGFQRRAFVKKLMNSSTSWKTAVFLSFSSSPSEKYLEHINKCSTFENVTQNFAAIWDILFLPTCEFAKDNNPCDQHSETAGTIYSVSLSHQQRWKLGLLGLYSLHLNLRNLQWLWVIMGRELPLQSPTVSHE